jgi:hypothetical protein
VFLSSEVGNGKYPVLLEVASGPEPEYFLVFAMEKD